MKKIMLILVKNIMLYFSIFFMLSKINNFNSFFFYLKIFEIVDGKKYLICVIKVNMYIFILSVQRKPELSSFMTLFSDFFLVPISGQLWCSKCIAIYNCVYTLTSARSEGRTHKILNYRSIILKHVCLQDCRPTHLNGYGVARLLHKTLCFSLNSTYIYKTINTIIYMYR